MSNIFTLAMASVAPELGCGLHKSRSKTFHNLFDVTKIIEETKVTTRIK